TRETARCGNKRQHPSVVFAGADPLGTGHGSNKQEAEQDAARVALEGLHETVVDPPGGGRRPPNHTARRAPTTRSRGPPRPPPPAGDRAPPRAGVDRRVVPCSSHARSTDRPSIASI